MNLRTLAFFAPTRPAVLARACACREERLGTFTHPDFVTSVHFHPLDDRIFLSGCFDKRLRLWKIPDGRYADFLCKRGGGAYEIDRACCEWPDIQLGLKIKTSTGILHCMELVAIPTTVLIPDTL